MHHRLPRIVGALGLAITLTAGLLGTTAAAIPDVMFGPGPVGSAPSTCTVTGTPPTAVGSPDTVKPGGYAIFYVWAQNCDTSTISQFYLTESGNLGSVAQASYTIVRADGTPQTGDCPTGDPLSCSFGQIKPGDTVYAAVVFTTPSDAGTGTLNGTFTWTTVGLGSASGDNSHGDSWMQSATVDTNSTPDFAGTYVLSKKSFTVANDPVGPGNAQSEAIKGTFTNKPVTVQDGDGFTPPGLLDCGGLNVPQAECDAFNSGQFGQWVSANVNNNETFSTAFTITIYIDASLIPTGVNKNNLTIYHQWYDDTTMQWMDETIGSACKTGTIPCRDVTTGKTVWTIVIQTFHNGNSKMY
jgi:hypothetical protein